MSGILTVEMMILGLCLGRKITVANASDLSCGE